MLHDTTGRANWQCSRLVTCKFGQQGPFGPSDNKIWYSKGTTLLHVVVGSLPTYWRSAKSLLSLKVDHTRCICRIKGLLASQGVQVPLHANFMDSVAAARMWNGDRLPPGLTARIAREYAHLQYVHQQIKELETEREELIKNSDDPSMAQVRQLMKLKAIGPNSAWLFVMEFFGWRQFRNRREVGGLAGLTPTPYQSGEEAREQGISKAGNRPVRAMAIEIAWGWLRYQPDSELTHWFHENFGHGGKRLRKVGIVALARKLLVTLWRYLETGEIPAGAQLNP